MKIHFSVDAKTGEILDLDVTRDDVHDSEMTMKMAENSMKSRKVSRVIADGTYDSIRLYRYLESMDIEQVIKTRRNARADIGPPSRMHILLDRIDLMLERKDALGVITYDYEGKKNALYRELLDELREEGSLMWPDMRRRKRRNIVDTIHFLQNHLSYGLQLADICSLST